MLNKVLISGAVIAGLASFAPAASAGGADKDGQFYATPIQKGAPRDLPGERLIPGVDVAVNVIDGVARPIIVDPIQGAGAAIVLPGELAPAAAPSAGPAPKAKRHARAHRGHHAKKVASRHHKGKKA